MVAAGVCVDKTVLAGPIPTLEHRLLHAKFVTVGNMNNIIRITEHTPAALCDYGWQCLQMPKLVNRRIWQPKSKYCSRHMTSSIR